MSDEMNLPDWLPERLERARKTAIHEFLAEQGFENAEALQQVREEHASFKTQLAQLTTENQQAVQQLAEAQATHQQLRIEMAFQQASSVYDFIHPSDARALLDMSAIDIDEQGSVRGMQDAVEKLVAARPYLLNRPYIPQIEGGDGREGLALEEKAFTPQEIETIKRRFRMGW